MKRKHDLSIIKYTLVLLSALFFGSLQMLQAQINTNKIRVDISSLSFKACNDSNNGLSTITVQSKQATTTDFEIAFNFPVGVTYQAGTGTITSQTGSGDFTIIEVDISNLNAPVFRLERPGNASWNINDVVTFTYQKTANCDAVQFSYSGGLFKDAHSITFNDSEGLQEESNTDETIASYNLFRAFLAIDDIPSVSDFTNVPRNRNIVIRNSGNGSVERIYHQVTISENLRPNYSLSFNGTALTPEISGETYMYVIDLSAFPFAGEVGNGDGFFENERITLVENLSLSSCASTGTDSVEHTSSWGCEPDTFCQSTSTKIGVFNFLEEFPDLSTSIQNKPRPKWNSPTTYTYTLTNDNNAENAYNVQINIGYATSTALSGPDSNPLIGSDVSTNRQLSNFRLRGGSNFSPNRWSNTTDASLGTGSYYIPQDFFRGNPDGAGGLEDLDGDGFFDDLAAGASLNINFDLTMLPLLTACSEDEATYVRDLTLISDFWSVTNCGTATPTLRENVNQQEIGRESLFEWINPREYDLEAFEGQIFNLNFIGNLIITDESPTCNGAEMLTDDPTTAYMATVNLPNGVSLHSSADARYTQVGNEVIFTETNLARYARNNAPTQIPVDFPLVVDCDIYDGPEYLEMFYTTSYASSCFNMDIHCGVFGITTFCGSPCSGPSTSSFDANRATAGWVDDTMSQRVVLDPAIHGTNYYMPKDEMIITSRSVMNNHTSDNLFFEVRYVTDDNGTDMSDIITFDFGNITINDLSSVSQTTQISVDPILTTTNGNEHLLTFDLSSYRDIIAPTYQFGEDFEEDEVDIELHFRVKDNLPEQAELFQFYAFSGTFYSFNAANNKTMCITRSDRGFFFQNNTEIVTSTVVSANSCGENWLEISLETNTGADDKFPNEFRPPIQWQSATFNLPDGLVFNSAASSEGFPLLQPEAINANSSNEGLSYAVAGNLVTVTPDVRFRDHDQQENTVSTIFIPVTPSSRLSSRSTFNVSISYIDYAYSDAPELFVQTEDRTFNYENAAFEINTDFPVVTGSSELASFTVTVSTDSEELLAHNWLRVAPESDYTVTAAYLVENGLESALNVIQEEGIYYIEYGAIESGNDNARTIRFEGTFRDCLSQTIRVSQNYDCLGYPSSYNGIPFFNEQEYTLEPVSMAIQLDIIDQPVGTVDMCTDYDIVLEVRNAGEGDFIEPTINFALPRDINAIQVTNVEVEYPRNSGNIENISATVSGNNMLIALNQHSFINNRNSIAGSAIANNLDEQIALVSITLNPQCSYQSNTGITFEANGFSPCGNPEIGDGSRLASNPVIITGAEPPYSSNNLVISSPDFEGCNQQTISVETVLTDGETGTNDFTRVSLPAGLSYVSDSFVSTGTVTANFITTNTLNGQQEIEIALPSGVDRTQIIAYNFTVESSAEICAGEYPIELSSYVTTTGLTCAGTSCGTTEIITGQAELDITITKAVLEEAPFAPTASYVQGNSSSNYQLNFAIENTGNVDLASGITYDVFCADAIGSKTGNPIFSSSIQESIPVGSSFEENISFNVDAFCGTNSNIVIEFSPGQANCFCEPLAIQIASEPSLFEAIVSFDIDNIVVSEDEGSAVLNVSLIGQSQNAFTIDYTTADDTAFDNEDYTSTSGTLNFTGTEGETYPITVPITDDFLLEPLEYFNVILSNISTDAVGIGSNGIGTIGILDNEFDTDGDSQPDITDIDDDNDGILDTLEGDGTIDTDGDGYADSVDIDDDNDGIPTNVEAQSTEGYIPPTGNDSDNDGLDDAYEGTGDQGLDPVDTDTDTIPDYLDLDSDNDTVPDNNEGNDFNFDGIPDMTFIGIDTDNDGLDDGYEGSNIDDGFDSNDEINDPANDLPDTDGTEDVNYRDLNDDGDRTDTPGEDANGDGDPTNDDEDSDGIPDYLDPIDDRFNIPVIEDITILCGEALPPLPDLTNIAVCGTANITFSENVIDTSETDDYTIERRWEVADTCGSATTLTQLIYVLQTTPQEIIIATCITDNPIDLKTFLPEEYDQNGEFMITQNNRIVQNGIFDPLAFEIGEYQIAYASTEGVCKYYANYTITINADCVPCTAKELEVTKTLTLNGDGVNDRLEINGGDFCNFTFNLMVFNRWGNKVYEGKNYQNNWEGDSPNNKIGTSGKLPTGTYYYIIDVISDENPTEQVNGYIYLGGS